jgi:hypothetical protein
MAFSSALSVNPSKASLRPPPALAWPIASSIGVSTGTTFSVCVMNAVSGHDPVSHAIAGVKIPLPPRANGRG